MADFVPLRVHISQWIILCCTAAVADFVLLRVHISQWIILCCTAAVADPVPPQYIL